MWRMLLTQDLPAAPPVVPVERLSADDLQDLQELYRDGEPSGEAPDFFLPSMLAEGVYFAAREAGRLVAAAGTHLAAPSEDLATIGNVYTRRDRRGRGLAGAVTGAVVAELRRSGIGSIALNVRQSNAAALALYHRLGFRRYCPFYEGVARLRTPCSLPR
jgi:ribosomal-protein-alanine N-acetyltransferase